MAAAATGNGARSLVGPRARSRTRSGRLSRPARPTVRYRRIAGLDGLRALAVMSVMVFHFAPQLLRAGTWASTSSSCSLGS
ncbi:hypothetical protein NKG05_24995 [Oerskovia sp. M15]